MPDHIPPDSWAGRFWPEILEDLSAYTIDYGNTFREFAKHLGKHPNERPAAVAKAARSKMAAENASKRNLEARAWVLTEWASRTNKAESKASFARRHSALIKQRFKATVSPEQIMREWLPKLGTDGG